jgi:plastocyanin
MYYDMNRARRRVVQSWLLYASLTALLFIGFVLQESLAQKVTVRIEAGSSDPKTGKSYDPKELTVLAGTTVVWINMDSVGHSVTYGRPNETGVGSVFNSGIPLIDPGKTFQYKFDIPGEYSYFCIAHPWTTGKVIVSTEASPAARMITLNPTSGRAGATVALNGTGFPSGAQVTIRIDDKILATVPPEITVAPSGWFSALVTIPETAALGEHTISAREPGGSLASTTFTVVEFEEELPKPLISISPESVTRGMKVTVSGSGFLPGKGIIINLDSSLITRVEGSSLGKFNTTFTMPSTIALGTHNITATDGINVASTELLVVETLEGIRAFGLSKPKLVDQTGSEVMSPAVGMQILVRSEIENNLSTDQDFTYIVQIKDSGGATVMVSYMEGTIPADKRYRVAQSWFADEAGDYMAEVFVWKSIMDPTILAPMENINFSVSVWL